jgi:ATP-dependent helicase IRC3
VTTVNLRPYQEDCLQAINDSEERSLLVSLPTGTGKTVVFSELIRRRGGTALILAHRDELLTQAADKLRMVAPELAMSVGFVQAGRNDVRSQIVIGSVQTLASPKRLAQLPRRFDTVVVDEAHHAVAASYLRTLEHVGESPLVTGFTATPERHDKKTDLRTVFDEMVYARSLESMIREGYLCDLRAVRVEIDELDLSKVKKSRGDYQAEALGEALEDAHAVEHAVAAYQKEAAGRKGIAFFPTVATSQHAAAAFNAAGVPAAHVDGETPIDERREIMRRLSAGDITMLVNVAIATEGFDEPSLECIVIAAPTRSRIRYAQQVGRGTRLYPGKTDCLIIDVVGSIEEHSLQSVGVLFGLRRPPKPGETATQAKDRQNADDARLLQRQAPAPHSPMRVEVSSRAVQLFDRDAIAWARVDERWIVRLRNDEMIVLDPHDGAWRVLVFVRDREGPTGMRARIAARNLDLGYAQGAAETIIRNEDSIAFADGTAEWRSRPAPTEQLRTARRLGVTPEPGATKGQVADQIAIAVAAERLVNFDRAVREREAATTTEAL